MTDTDAQAAPPAGGPAAANAPAEPEFGAAPPAAPSPASPPAMPAPPVTQALIDAVTQLEANKKDLSPTGFQRRLQLAYAVYDQAHLMVQDIEAQHARLLSDLLAVERRSPLPPTAAT